MKLHKDGTLEGTPYEIAEYNRLVKEPYPPLHNTPWKPQNPLFAPAIKCGETKSIVDIQLEAQKNMNPWERQMASL